MTVQNLSTDHSRASADEAHSHGGVVPNASYADRFASTDPAAFEVPSGREEEWRFTPLRRLRGLIEDAPIDGAGTRLEIQAPEGLVVEQRPVEASDRGASGYVPIDRVSARVWEATADVTVVDVPAEAEIAEPVFLTITGEGEQTATAGHTLIRVGANARATVVTFFEGYGDLR